MLTLLKIPSGLLYIILLLFCTPASYGDDKNVFVVTYRGPASENDTREHYYKEILTLALEKTRSTYGKYKILEAPPMNQLRDAYAVDQQMYPNYVVDENYEDKFIDTNITYIPFPLDFGLTGVRICFVNPKVKEEIKSVTTVEQLKRFSIGQGIGWADAEILRQNGFKVVTMQNYDGLFKMVAVGRIDLFCRGINELATEFESFQNINNLTYDESFALVYPLPRFFIMNKHSVLLKKRVKEGLFMAYQDGSLKQLFLEYHSANIEFANMKKRKIFTIENPLIKKLSKDYEQYLYKLE